MRCGSVARVIATWRRRPFFDLVGVAGGVLVGEVAVKDVRRAAAEPTSARRARPPSAPCEGGRFVAAFESIILLCRLPATLSLEGQET